MFDLDDEIDCSLIQIDHTAFSFYIPGSYANFWRDDVETGLTIVFQLGHGLKIGHGVWNIQDMRRTWRHDIEPLARAACADCEETELAAAALMSLILPDRVAWFAVPCMASRARTLRFASPQITFGRYLRSSLSWVRNKRPQGRLVVTARASLLQAIGGGPGSGDPPEHEGPEHGDGVGRRAEEMPRHLAGGVEAGDGAALAQDLRFRVGGDAAECVGDGADQRIGEIGRPFERASPVRFRRRDLAAAAASASVRVASNLAASPVAAAL